MTDLGLDDKPDLMGKILPGIEYYKALCSSSDQSLKPLLGKMDQKTIDYKVNGIERIPGVFNITFPTIDGQNLVMQLDMAGIGISFGAACASGTVKASSLLLDIGLTEEQALSTVRISFGKIHTNEDVQIVVDTIEQIVNQNVEKKMAHVC